MQEQTQCINKEEEQKQKIIDDNYQSVYYNLLPDESQKISCKPAINIGERDVYVLSDIEGQNLTFLKMLEDLGLVTIYNDQNIPQQYETCTTKDGCGYTTIKYNFNYNR